MLGCFAQQALMLWIRGLYHEFDLEVIWAVVQKCIAKSSVWSNVLSSSYTFASKPIHSKGVIIDMLDKNLAQKLLEKLTRQLRSMIPQNKVEPRQESFSKVSNTIDVTFKD